MNLKEKALSENLRGLGRVAVALSGGLDSAVLLHFCASVLGAENCAAITADTPQMPASETDNSEKFAAIWECAAVLSEAAGFPKI